MAAAPRKRRKANLPAWRTVHGEPHFDPTPKEWQRIEEPYLEFADFPEEDRAAIRVAVLTFLQSDQLARAQVSAEPAARITRNLCEHISALNTFTNPIENRPPHIDAAVEEDLQEQDEAAQHVLSIFEHEFLTALYADRGITPNLDVTTQVHAETETLRRVVHAMVVASQAASQAVARADLSDNDEPDEHWRSMIVELRRLLKTRGMKVGGSKGGTRTSFMTFVMRLYEHFPVEARRHATDAALGKALGKVSEK